MNKVISVLADAGLTELEAKTYMVLLQKNQFTATEISKLVGISRTQTYQILENLIQFNLCVQTLGSVKKYSAVDPKIAVQRLSNNLDQKKQQLTSIKTEIEEIYNDNHSNQNNLDFIKVLNTRTSIVECVESLEKKAVRSVLSFTKPPYAMNIEDLQSLNLAQKISMQSGVKYRSIYEVESDRIPDFVKMVEIFEEAGEDIRISYDLPIKLIIYDGETVLFTLKNKLRNVSDLTAMEIQHSDLARTLKQTFEMHWQNSCTFKEFKIKEGLF
jgi:HTH-type transcriptional regulator, sugar sensing transcriptional regulator